jgi:hypothetical protein
MDPDTREMAFEPFFTTKQPGHGTGLGLSQVYGFIKQSGGYCKLDSQPGVGTRVSLYLPSAECGETASASTGTDRPVLARGNGETVLVTEDDAEVRAYSADLLQELGYRVLTAADAPQTLRLLAAQPGIALLFTDLGLPGTLNWPSARGDRDHPLSPLESTVDHWLRQRRTRSPRLARSRLGADH